MTPREDLMSAMSRRELFQSTGVGLSSIALTWLLNEELRATQKPSSPTAPKPSHFPAKAKNIIFMHMVGAPSQLDLFDYKPMLQKHDGKKMPDHLWQGLRLAFVRKQRWGSATA